MEIQELYGQFYNEIVGYCVAMTKSRASAEDLVQETYLRALGHWEQLEPLSRNQCRSWLYKTARNLFIDQVRRKSRERSVEQCPPLVPFEEDFSRASVAQLVGCLPQSERTIFILRYFEGYNATELGEMLDLPSATVRSRLVSARRRLRAWIED